jgi:hypothetical protein
MQPLASRQFSHLSSPKIKNVYIVLNLGTIWTFLEKQASKPLATSIYSHLLHGWVAKDTGKVIEYSNAIEIWGKSLDSFQGFK